MYEQVDFQLDQKVNFCNSSPDDLHISGKSYGAETFPSVALCLFPVAAKHLVRWCCSGVLVSGVYAPGTTKLAVSGALTVNIMCCSNIPCPRWIAGGIMACNHLADILPSVGLCLFPVAAKHLVRWCGSGVLVSGVYAPGTTKLAASGALTVNIMSCGNIPCPRWIAGGMWAIKNTAPNDVDAVLSQIWVIRLGLELC